MLYILTLEGGLGVQNLGKPAYILLARSLRGSKVLGHL